MKTNKNELDVDFMGGQEQPLTIEEEKALSDFFSKHKLKGKKNALAKKGKSAKQDTSTA